MRKVMFLIILSLSLIGLNLNAGVQQEKSAKPRIEVCFVLDSTGSMGGLIEGAKQKIWSIANQMISAKPTPDIKIALISYRDRGDEYIAKVFDLSADIDKVYSNLQQFQAGGGGDHPESVNQALNEAVTKISWSKSKDVLKLVFLVGDAPPHMDYRDDIKYKDVCQQAVRNDLVINTVQCGSDNSTAAIWKEVADLAEGKYVAISQTGDMQIASTPMDKDLAGLNAKLRGTNIAYGSAERKTGFARREALVGAMAAPAVADRMLFMEKSAGSVAAAEGDLVSDVKKGSVTLEGLKEEEMPEEFKGKNAEERKTILQAKSEERKQLEAKISELLKSRNEYLAAENAKLAREGKKNSFDARIYEMIKEQAAKKGLSYQ